MADLLDGVHHQDELHRSFPVELEALVRGYRAMLVTHGCSGCSIYRLVGRDRSGLYLKISHKGSTVSLRPEMERLRWLQGKLPVPRLHLFEEDQEREYLLIGEVEGVNASDSTHGRDLPRLVDALAEGLLTLHSLPIGDCPFDHTIGSEIERARRRMEQRLVDETDFDARRIGRSAEDLFEELMMRRPARELVVFTHGDYSLPNVILHGGRISGFIDLGSAGVADRYRDLALAVRSLDYNFGRGWDARLFDAYGIDRPDVEMVEFYQLMDEFF